MFLDSVDFPSLNVLSQVWTDIRAELLSLSSQYFISWPEKSIYNGNWTVFPLYKFGTKVESMRRCARGRSPPSNRFPVC